ncbi:hypothetical protein [Clostridium algidicarnis]|uniref:hypothetical protein n=1 Tax=Clostridium algidicarnis TaxID=37659 RepID=UPI001C0C4FC9|nr:hypothetical protein [Clostridium algidicarnis]MBU3204129.1 hypothetical protein [Clostridium algidicarnis]MBU3212283.1 hypothetical protein [Clostridium algidicarnis]MBU3221212.1 hypothetical protein [Clostridium algidicarnis]
MKKNYKIVIKLFILISFFMIALVKTQVYAQVIELNSDSNGFNISSEDLFDIKDIDPGDIESSKITIKNSQDNNIKLYLTHKKDSEIDIEGDLFKQLQMTVDYDNEELYSGSLGDFSKENLYLGDFQKGESKDIDIKVYLQGEETDNKYQNKYIKSQWIFTANVDENQKVEQPKENNIWGLPKTGGISLITFCIAGIALILVGVEKILTNKERTDETNF